MSSKGKQLSVIIAGATGSTGRNLVSRLVSHPDVTRVVALARHPIPVNRWTSVFPQLHSGDALRYLSVVPVDWVRVLADTANIPPSYVRDGIWRQEDEEVERIRFLNHMVMPQLVDKSGIAGNMSGLPHRTRVRTDWSSVVTTESAVGVRPLGYVKFTPRGRLSTRGEPGEDGVPTPVHAQGNAHASEAERVQDSQAFLQQLLHNSFYHSVFSGHHVAINCLGTSKMLSSSQVVLVDYELSIAFAKLIRLFNCMAHAESSEDEEKLLVEATSRELDSVLWGEIYSACYGKKPSGAPSKAAALSDEERDTLSRIQRGDNGISVGVEPADSSAVNHAGTTASDSTSASDANGIATSSSAQRQPDVVNDVQRMSRGSMATLRHFSQVSVRAANTRSPIPYLRQHGRRDRKLLALFNRPMHGFASPGIVHSLFFSTAMTHTVTMHGRSSHLRSSSMHAMDGSGLSHDESSAAAVRFAAAPSTQDRRARRHADKMRRREETVRQWETSQRQRQEGSHLHHRHHHARGIERFELPRAMYRAVHNVLYGPALPNMDPRSESNYEHHYMINEAEREMDADAIARKRAELLLRRDVVKVWENANLTIWRPGVLSRPHPRLAERLFSLIERPVDVRCLAECIVDDIMESLYKESVMGEIGSVKIINGKSVGRRAHMKEIEDGLDAKDSSRGKGLLTVLFGQKV